MGAAFTAPRPRRAALIYAFTSPRYLLVGSAPRRQPPGPDTPCIAHNPLHLFAAFVFQSSATIRIKGMRYGS